MAIGTTAAILGGAALGVGGSLLGANKAAKASGQAANIQAQSQREQLEYLKEVERLPQHFREQALTQLGSIYGIGAPAANDPPQPPLAGFNYQPGSGMFGNLGEQIAAYQSQQQPATQPAMQQPQGKGAFLQGLTDDPFYRMLQERGEEGVLRNASVTGGLRSGNVQDSLYRANQDALFNVYNEQVSGLKGLAGLPSNANQIGNVMGSIGATQAGGILGAGRAKQAGYQGISDSVGNAVGLALQYDAFSDGRLKKDIEYIGIKDGHAWYRWTWNQLAGTLGLTGESEALVTPKLRCCCPPGVISFPDSPLSRPEGDVNPLAIEKSPKTLYVSSAWTVSNSLRNRGKVTPSSAPCGLSRIFMYKFLHSCNDGSFFFFFPGPGVFPSSASLPDEEPTSSRAISRSAR